MDCRNRTAAFLACRFSADRAELGRTQLVELPETLPLAHAHEIFTCVQLLCTSDELNWPMRCRCCRSP